MKQFHTTTGHQKSVFKQLKSKTRPLPIRPTVISVISKEQNIRGDSIHQRIPTTVSLAYLYQDSRRSRVSSQLIMHCWTLIFKILAIRNLGPHLNPGLFLKICFVSSGIGIVILSWWWTNRRSDWLHSYQFIYCFIYTSMNVYIYIHIIYIYILKNYKHHQTSLHLCNSLHYTYYNEFASFNPSDPLWLVCSPCPCSWHQISTTEWTGSVDLKPGNMGKHSEILSFRSWTRPIFKISLYHQ